MNLQTAAKVLGGEVIRGQIVCPGPGHSRADRSLSVRFHPDAPDGFICHSFAGDDPIRCKDHVRDRLGILHDFRNERRSAPRPQPALERAVDTAGKQNTEKAWNKWSNAVPLAASDIAMAYFANRGIGLDREVLDSDALRFLPDQPILIEKVWHKVPTVLAKLVDIHTNGFRAIQRVFLRPDGSARIGRRMLGPAAGAVCKLSADENATTVLGIAEGVETALSLPQIPEAHGVPVWATMSASGLAAFPVLPRVEVLWIGVDHEPTGIGAAAEVAARWSAAGREVFRVQPNAVKADINDLVKGRRNG